MNSPEMDDYDRAPELDAWGSEVHDDIFSSVADTRREKRPRVDGAPSDEPAEPRDSPGVSALPGGIPTAAASPVRVLLADDDEMIQHILGYQLGNRHWRVTCSGDGAEVQRLLEKGGIDVLLVDLNLPHRNAFELLEALAGSGGETRVIVMSEQAQEDKIVRAFALGADDFVPKPFNPRVVMSRIQRLLGRV